MDIRETLQQTVDTVVFARNLNALRADAETFENATDFFTVNPDAGESDRLLDVRGPFVERVRPPAKSKLTWHQLASELGIHSALRDAVTHTLFGGDGDGRLYVHQEQALRKGMSDTPEGLLLSVPTATGKTESFLLPILQHCLANQVSRGSSPLRAVVVYPTKTLEADQLNRLLRLVHAVNRGLSPSERPIRIGIWDGDTPDGVVEREPVENPEADADAREAPPLRVGDSVRGLECPRHECRAQANRAKLTARLQGYQLRCGQHPSEPILDLTYTRQALGQPNGAVDIIFTTPESLDHALASPRSKLRRHLRNAGVRFLVFDEAHYWTGTGGVAIRQLNQRLLDQFREREPATRVVLASATVADPDRLLRDLTGEGGTAVRFVPEAEAAGTPDLVVPPAFQALLLPDLVAALVAHDSQGRASDTASRAFKVMGLSVGGKLTKAGHHLRKVTQEAASEGETIDELIAENQLFRETWREVLIQVFPRLGSSLWPAQTDGAPVTLAPWVALKQKVESALPADSRALAAEILETLLSYGRGAGIFVDRYHVFLVPPTGIFFDPQARRLTNSQHARATDPALGASDDADSEAQLPPYPEIGTCSCGQPYVALVRGRHNGWLELPPFKAILPEGHLLRQAMLDARQPGIYWPVGHMVPFGVDAYADRNLMPKREGVRRQRCVVCRRMLSLEMFKFLPENGFRFTVGQPRPARAHVEHLMNYLLTAAVQSSHVGRVLAISDGRNIAGRIGRNFLRDDTSRLGAAGLFVHRVLADGPTPAVQLHERIRRYENNMPAGELWDRLIRDVYAMEPKYRSPIREAAKSVVFDDSFLDRYRWILLDYALLMPAEIAAAEGMDPFERSIAWHIFAYTATQRPRLPVRAVELGDDREEDDDPDEPLYVEPLYDDVAATARLRAQGQRFVTRQYLRELFLPRWTRGKLAGKTGRSDAAVEEAIDKGFRLLVDAGFLAPLPGEKLAEILLDNDLVGEQQRKWVTQYGLRLDRGNDSGAYTYETRRGNWKVAISRERTWCRQCGKAWPGSLSLCWNCGNNDRQQMVCHDPVVQPATEVRDRLGSFLQPLIHAWKSKTAPPFRTVEALRAGLPPLDRALVEDAFRNGKLNVLSATSLMELGVDIGRLDTLLQHGVPPTFTNYVQRSGRVGRGIGRPASVYNILRPSNPIDMYFFGDLQNRFFRDLAPLHIPEARDTLSVVAAQAMSQLLSVLAVNTQTPDGALYLTHWGSPQSGSKRDVENAETYLIHQVGAKADVLRRVLSRFGLDAETAERVLTQLLDANLKPGETPVVGSHAYRVEEFLNRVVQPGVGAEAQARAIEKMINYPILLQSVGMFGMYRSNGEPHAVRLKFPNNRIEIESGRSADQLLRECFPGPGRGELGGFFYRGMTMWRVKNMAGEETTSSQQIGYCHATDCDFFGSAFLRLTHCPCCGEELATVRTAEPADCEAESIEGFGATDPRVFAFFSSLIPASAPPGGWQSCDGGNNVGFLPRVDVLHVVPMFAEAGSIKPSRIHVPNPQYPGEYCAGIGEQLPATLLRLPRERFGRDVLSPAVLWSAFTAFRRAVGVLLRRDVSDFYTGWDVDEVSVYFSVADTHTGGTGVAKQWHDFLRATPERFSAYLAELRNCPRCSRYCHFCLLQDRMSPRVVEHLDRELVGVAFGF
jgi:hypothetical protein